MLVVLCALGLTPAMAQAEQPTVTMQAEAANARFLAFAPPPPGGAAAVCLVDTGVDENPDTAGALVARLAIDGGDPGDVHRTRHGTRMAMLMAGPVNDWGSVGAWPHARIVSIRAMPPGESAFPFHYYEQATILCGERAGAHAIATVNLSLGGVGASGEQIARLRDRFVNLHQQGLNVVAAAGNAGGAVEHPAAIPEALAIAAADRTGDLCAFSARGAGIDLLAPGCRLDAALADGRPAYSNGTSDAAAFASTALAALRSYRPGLGPDEAQRLLLDSARPTPAGAVLDMEAAFRAAGLGDVVAAGNAEAARYDPTPSTPAGRPRSHVDREPNQVAAIAAPSTRTLPRPRVARRRVRGRRLELRLANRPENAVVSVRLSYSARRGEFQRRERAFRRTSDIVALTLPSRRATLELQFLQPDGASSEITMMRMRRQGKAVARQ